jgi:hypothetical protein
MELDELKSVWTQYDKKLSQTLKLNEQLLRKMDLNDSKRELQKPLMYELTGIGLTFMLVTGILGFSIRFINEPKYSIPGFISAIIALVYIVFGIIKANKFMHIDYYGSSIIKLQRDIAELNQLVLRLRKYELILTPSVALQLPLVFKGLYGADIYSNIKLFWTVVILILGIGFPMLFWVNKHLYDEKFRNSDKLLKEIENYESDKQ